MKKVNDFHLIKSKEGMQPIETYFECLKSKIESGGKIKTGIFSSVSSPKRKFIFTTFSVEPSPGKKTKIKLHRKLIILENNGSVGGGTRAVSLGRQIPLCVVISKQRLHMNKTIWKWLLDGTVPGEIEKVDQ